MLVRQPRSIGIIPQRFIGPRAPFRRPARRPHPVHAQEFQRRAKAYREEAARELVVDVTYLTWTEANLLRQVSSYRGQREDKPAKHVLRSTSAVSFERSLKAIGPPGRGIGTGTKGVSRRWVGRVWAPPFGLSPTLKPTYSGTLGGLSPRSKSNSRPRQARPEL